MSVINNIPFPQLLFVTENDIRQRMRIRELKEQIIILSTIQGALKGYSTDPLL
jgi:hypothetical protein